MFIASGDINRTSSEKLQVTLSDRDPQLTKRRMSLGKHQCTKVLSLHCTGISDCESSIIATGLQNVSVSVYENLNCATHHIVMYFVGKLLGLLFIATIGGSRYSGMNQGLQVETAVQFLEEWMNPSDHLVYTECRNRLGNFETLLKRAFVWKYTRLSPLDYTSLFPIFYTNYHNNIRTVVVTHAMPRNHALCTRSIMWVLKTMPFVDVIVFNDVNDLYGQFQDHVSYRGRYPACKMTQQKGEKGLTSGSNTQTVFSRKCFSLKSRRSNKWISALQGSELVLGCRRIPRLPASETTCDEKRYHLVHATLRHFNVTVMLRFYGTDLETINRDFLSGDVDVVLNQWGLDKRNYGFYAPPHTVTYGYETFYAWKGKAETSFFHTVQHSPQAMGCLFLIMMLGWLALSLGHYLQTSGNIDVGILLDFATFLIASFLSTSAHVRQTFGSATHCHPLKFQNAIRALWMVGIFPLSFYLRGELTSRLTVQLPPNPVDTIEELEGALDAGQLLPCIVTEGAMMHLLKNISNLSNMGPIYRKLKAGFQLRRGAVPREFPNEQQCLRYCAGKPGYACVMYEIEQCPGEIANADYIKSKEHFKFVLAATPVRKDLEQANDYGKLQRRIFETDLNAYNFKSAARCGLLNSGRSIISPENLDSQVKEPLQFFELSNFFVIFCAALSLATVAFALECTFARSTSN